MGGWPLASTRLGTPYPIQLFAISYLNYEYGVENSLFAFVLWDQNFTIHLWQQVVLTE